VIEQHNNGWIMSSNLMRIRLDWSRVRPAYLHLQLSFDVALRDQVRRSINSGGRDVANAAVLNSLKFAWPMPDEQDRICKIARAHEIEAERHKAGLAKLHLQKSGLMQDLLTGNVSVALLLESAPA
jgi:type I restriction enzyme S subunit